MNNHRFLIACGLIGLSFAGSASAHSFGAQGAGFVQGLAHPFLGLDHLLAMFAVGLWASQLGGTALWRVPLAFVAVMAGGALWANLGLDAALAETVIALSVLALGVMVAGAVRLPMSWSLPLVALFALGHGYAHGLEIPDAASPWGYGAGFLLATAGLHLAGIGAGLSAHRHRALVRLGGCAIAVGGAWLLAGV